MKIDFDQIRELLAVVSQTDITELSIESGEEKVTVKKSPPPQMPTTLEVPALSQSESHLHTMRTPILSTGSELLIQETVKGAKSRETHSDSQNGLVPITSPMVGTFYGASSPSAPAFISVGDVVTIGQTVCIIEAMKLMNDLPSEVAGRVVKICVDNGTTVEYGQPLFMIDPKG